jgi:hypothetical protein
MDRGQTVKTLNNLNNGCPCHVWLFHLFPHGVEKKKAQKNTCSGVFCAINYMEKIL